MSQKSKSEHSNEADFNVSFGSSDEERIELDMLNNPCISTEQAIPQQKAIEIIIEPNSIENPPKTVVIKKPFAKISINLKQKLMPNKPLEDNRGDSQGLHDDNAMLYQSNQTNHNEDYANNDGNGPIKNNNDDIVVPKHLLIANKNNNATGHAETSTSDIMKQVFPHRYFILKKLTKTQMDICMEMNYCVILLAYKKRLHDAYQVILINNDNNFLAYFIVFCIFLVFLCFYPILYFFFKNLPFSHIFSYFFIFSHILKF